MKKQKRYPKGHFIGLGIAIGMPMGIPLWLTTGNPGLIGTGIAIGVAMGMAMEQAYNKNPRPLTAKEKRHRKIAIAAGVVLLVAFSILGVIAFLYYS
jgi:hypothetical protein